MDFKTAHLLGYSKLFRSTNSYWAIFLSLWLVIPLYGQEKIQWAQKVDFQYNQYGEGEFSGQKAVGPPDVGQPGTLSEDAFRLKNLRAFGTLVLEFNPQYVQQVVIVESNSPGKIQDVTLIDENEKRNKVYSGSPTDLDVEHRVFTFNIPRSNARVKKVEINVNTVNNPGWYQIDAVGLIDSSDPALIQASMGGQVSKLEQTIAFATEKEPLSENINTSYEEKKPIISPDGKTLYFVRQFYPGNNRGTKDPQDIYISELENGEWTKARNIGKPLNDGNPNGVCAVTPDGNFLLVINGYDEYGGVNNGASIARKSPNGYEKPKQVEIMNFYINSDYQDYHLSNNNKFLLMAVERDDTYGDQDLYISFRLANGKFNEPLNLGPVINSIAAEYSPFLASDNKTLFFASEGHSGYGKADIFYSRRLDETWQNWSKPKNLGPSVNSAGQDGYYTVTASGEFAYLSSNDKGNNGSADIFRIGLPREFKPDPVLLVSGRIYDAESNMPLPDALVTVERLPEGLDEGTASPDHFTGQYQMTLAKGKNYGFRVVAEGYLPMEQNANLSDIEEFEEKEIDFPMEKIKKGKKIVLNNIFFIQGTDQLEAESMPSVLALVDLMKKNPSMQIELQGHTDNQGDYKKNIELSRHRAEVIREVIISQGIAPYRVQATGLGSAFPIASNANPETRKLNRRVEVEITNQ